MYGLCSFLKIFVRFFISNDSTIDGDSKKCLLQTAGRVARHGFRAINETFRLCIVFPCAFASGMEGPGQNRPYRHCFGADGKKPNDKRFTRANTGKI